jgi:peptide/nickel transport system ATP-binding protein
VIDAQANASDQAKSPAPDPVLSIRDLTVRFHTPRGDVHAVNGVDLDVNAGECLALVGESGSGKSVSMLTVAGLLPERGVTVSGHATFGDRQLIGMSDRELNQNRGREIGFVFQDPISSLNPVHTVGRQIGESLVRHDGVRARVAKRRAAELLAEVGIPDPDRRVNSFPHEFSGGMRQRVMIALALACAPRLLIADEPTTALDVTIQAQILERIRELRDETGAAVILVTHDLGVVADIADRIAVMYAGRIAEVADVEALFADPQHPYTLGLLASIPRLDVERERLPTIAGSVPPPRMFPPGCRFSSRCPFADRRCRAEPPPFVEIGPRHRVACWKAPLEDHVGEAA